MLFHGNNPVALELIWPQSCRTTRNPLSTFAEQVVDVNPIDNVGQFVAPTVRPQNDGSPRPGAQNPGARVQGPGARSSGRDARESLRAHAEPLQVERPRMIEKEEAGPLLMARQDRRRHHQGAGAQELRVRQVRPDAQTPARGARALPIRAHRGAAARRQEGRVGRGRRGERGARA